MRSGDLMSLALVVLFGLSAPRLAAAQLPSVVPKEAWSAEWITSPDGPQRDVSVLHFRKVIDLAQPPQHFLVHVSADNQFILYVNQQRVGSGPSRGDLGHWKYESYDIAPLLHPGKNLLAAVVWNFGVLTPLAQISDRTGFVLHGDSEAERIADTGQSWEVEEEKGIRVPSTPETSTTITTLPSRSSTSTARCSIGIGTLPLRTAPTRTPLMPVFRNPTQVDAGRKRTSLGTQLRRAP
jgi:hypothetical protein